MCGIVGMIGRTIHGFAEHDAFFCFNNLMAEIQSVFNRNFDQEFGIGSKMETMVRLLGEFDAELLQNLNSLHLEPAHFAFRWITLLLAREFLLPDVLILWDSILADKHRFDLLLYICCSMLILIRKELLTCDFSEAVRLLQNYPYTDVGHIISHALNLYNHFVNKPIKVLRWTPGSADTLVEDADLSLFGDDAVLVVSVDHFLFFVFSSTVHTGVKNAGLFLSGDAPKMKLGAVSIDSLFFLDSVRVNSVADRLLFFVKKMQIYRNNIGRGFDYYGREITMEQKSQMLKLEYKAVRL
ncbi:hypothetical protein ACTXT7_001469 [Hymenolepis weldensis]